MMMHPHLQNTVYFLVYFLALVANFSLGNLVGNYHLKAQGRSLIRDRVSGIRFAVLNRHQQKYLQVLPFQVLQVKDEKMCEVTCVGNHQCFSFNLVAEGGQLRCELLSTDMFNSSQNLFNKTNSVHLSIKSTCYPMPCKNDAKCIPFYTNNTHFCNCTYPSYYGQQCDKVEGVFWSPWSSWSDTCGPKPIQTSLTQHRSRNCTYNSPQGEDPSNQCAGISDETRNCEATPMTAEEIAGCDGAVGLEDNRILDSQMTASSYYHATDKTYPWYSRLNHGSCWAPSAPAIGEHLQIDFRKTMRLTKIASQGRSNGVQWVTKYSVNYSDDGSTWANYGSASYIKEFDANKEGFQVVTHILEIPIVARGFAPYHVTAAMTGGRNNRIISMRKSVVSQGKTILCSCLLSWLPSRDGAKPLYTMSGLLNKAKSRDLFIIRSIRQAKIFLQIRYKNANDRFFNLRTTSGRCRLDSGEKLRRIVRRSIYKV